MDDKVLGKWRVVVEARGLAINWWERDEGGESFEFDEGGDTFELRRADSDYYVALYLVHGMTFPLPTAVGEARARLINGWAGQDVVLIDHDEDFVIHVVVMARVGKPSKARLDNAMVGCRSLRELFFRDDLIASEVTPKSNGNTSPWPGSELP